MVLLVVVCGCSCLWFGVLVVDVWGLSGGCCEGSFCFVGLGGLGVGVCGFVYGGCCFVFLQSAVFGRGWCFCVCGLKLVF